MTHPEIFYPYVWPRVYEYPFYDDFLWMWDFAVIAVGLCVGSFLNVCVWRLPRGESVIFNPSHCPDCGRHIRCWENIPILSYLALRGRCAGCGKRISLRYPLMEALTALLFWLVWYRVVCRHQPLEAALPGFLLTGVLIGAAAIDCRHYIIPDALTFPAMVGGLALAFAFPEIWGIRLHGLAARGLSASNAAAGIVAAVGVMATASLVGRRVFRQDALGWGDVKLVAVVGACYGFTPAAWFFTILVGSLAGAVAGVICLILGKGRRRRGRVAIPFGPCLAAAAYLWILYGPEISQRYLAWNRRVILDILSRFGH